MFKTMTAFAIAAAAALLLLPADAQAGATYDFASCSKNADGSGTCAGSMHGFRASTDPNAYAGFTNSNGGGANQFFAWLNGSFYSCSVASTDTATLALWPQVMDSKSYFSINWDSSGRCGYIVLQNNSSIGSN